MSELNQLIILTYSTFLTHLPSTETNVCVCVCVCVSVCVSVSVSE
jgi:hypothetical protein